MPEPVPRRLPDGAAAIEAAAVIQSLRSLADSLEETCLDQQAGEVLAEVDVAIEGDDPANVG